jgi:hypothetical protein
MFGIKSNGGITPIILSDKNTLFPPGPSVDPILDNNSWATIKSVCESGEAANYWAVGDYKLTSVDNTDVRAVLVDLTTGRYKDSSNNDNHAVFELRWYNASISGDDKWLQYYPTRKAMNSSGSNAGGWNGCEMRTWLNGDFKALLDAELQAALDKTYKIPAMNGGSQAGTSLTYSDDYLILANEKEIFGTASYIPSAESSVTSQFGLYANNNNATYRKRYRDTGSASSWWLRSTSQGSTASFVYVLNNGNIDYYDASLSCGVVPFIPM